MHARLRAGTKSSVKLINSIKSCFCSSSSSSSCKPELNESHFMVPSRKNMSQLLKLKPPLIPLNQLLALTITQSFTSDLHLTHSLIHCYLSCNCIATARYLFDYCCYLNSPPTLLWNLMIRAYSKLIDSSESIVLFKKMVLGFCCPDKYTFTFVMTSCSRQMSVVCGQSVHAVVIKIGYEFDLYVGNSLINLYCVFVRMGDAQNVFDGMLERDVFSWTSLVGGYAKHGEIDRACEIFGLMPSYNEVSWTVMISGFVGSGRYVEALRYFHDMLCYDGNMKPNEAVLVCALSACAHLGALDHGKWIHSYINEFRIYVSSNISTALIDMYAKCGKIDCASQVFYELSRPDVQNFTSMITGFSNHGLGKHGLRVFNQMLAKQVKPNEITILGVLNGCSHAGLVEEGSSIFFNMESLWGIVPKLEHYGCYVDLLGRAGYLERAFRAVKNMPMEPDIVIWRALLSACRVHRDVKLGEIIINHIEQLDYSKHDGGAVLLSNLYASLGRWDGVAQVRKVMGVRTNNFSIGCSWIEVNGVVHEFRVADKLHPQILEIRDKLSEILSRLRIEGYITNTIPVLFDLTEEEKEQAMAWHSEKLAIAFGLMSTEPGTSIRIVKNLRTCEDCHTALKAISKVFSREIIVRDRTRFHTFQDGNCLCNDYW
ncbi:Pentatricopeptide repeat-containing protein [Heracleum sosnowskyi]|uniref:Pentatricopeptide repeat-containing protein n=1 Tax=Heracleum sosnowskyi TaxID=360622 RepID=A0AAD8MHQ0_9APIA|nr:Pentatricopeptide repeat-containing protein [Heracleum sosnowskyi]